MQSQQFIDEMKTKLLDAKKKLEGDLAGLKGHEELGSDLDSNIQEVEGDEVSQDLITRIKTDLEKINKALAKIEDGSYGTDDQGKAIPQERLRAMPWADTSI
jgi:RNA polymerase-binding transcription factor DksA